MKEENKAICITALLRERKLYEGQEFYPGTFHEIDEALAELRAKPIFELKDKPVWVQLGFDSIWNIHPSYPREDWKYEVAAEDTVLGYWDWVAELIEQAGETD